MNEQTAVAALTEIRRLIEEHSAKKAELSAIERQLESVLGINRKETRPQRNHLTTKSFKAMAMER